MRRRQSAETNENFMKLVDKWIGIEEATVAMAAQYEERFQNPFLKTVIDVIARDSAKHKEILELIKDGYDHSFIITPDELASLSEFIKKHDGIEHQSMMYAGQMCDQIRAPVQRLLLKYMLRDERMHDYLTQGLDNLKSEATKGG